MGKRDLKELLQKNKIAMSKSSVTLINLTAIITILLQFLVIMLPGIFSFSYIIPRLLVAVLIMIPEILLLPSNSINAFFYIDRSKLNDAQKKTVDKISAKPFNRTKLIVPMCIAYVLIGIEFTVLGIFIITNWLFEGTPSYSAIIPTYACYICQLCMIIYTVVFTVITFRFLNLEKGYANGTISEKQVFERLKVTPPKTVSDAQAKPAQAEKSVTDQLKEYKELKDNGLITEEEYEAKRKEILKL